VSLSPPSVVINHFAGHPAINHELAASQKTLRGIEQPGGQRGDILRPPDTPRRIQPGLIAFTRTSGPRLIATAWVSATRPPLEAA